MSIEDLNPTEEDSADIVTIVIENTKGSKNSYKWDQKDKIFKLDRVLYSSTTYPTDFGIVPKTQCDDGEPLRSFVLTEQPTFTGCVVKAKPLGILKMLVNGQYNDKLISVPIEDERYLHASELDDISHVTRQEIAHFFIQSNELFANDVKIVAWKGPAAAEKAIEHAINLYRRKKGV